jgi:hypothetical protein
MAQLVKLQDYISRYQIDLARYPTQFVRLKKSQWDRTKLDWQTGTMLTKWEHIDETSENVSVEEEDKPKLSLLRKFFPGKKEKVEQIQINETEILNDLDEDEIPEEVSQLTFEPNIVYNPKTENELKRVFLDQFFHFQLKWASSTLREKSYVDPKFMRDTFLRSILQSLPDSFLVFYNPVLKLKKAPIELDIIIMAPTECIIVKLLEQENQAVYVADGDRFWTKKVGKVDRKVLNPVIEINRTETIVKQLLQSENVDIPVRKVLLSRNGYIDYPGAMYGFQIVDKRNYLDWFTVLKRSSSPMKHMQMKASQAILQHAETTSFHRDIWQTEQPVEERE